MHIPRSLKKDILDKLASSDKGIVVYGARQTGKTTLVNEILQELSLKTLVVNGDRSAHMDVLSSRDFEKLRNLVAGYEVLVVDEAQGIPEIGINLKIILDGIKNLKVIVTGSSALDLRSKISEPLTGRVWSYKLYPISQMELGKMYNGFELQTQLEERLVYGGYPDIFNLMNWEEKREYLQNLSDAYLYKDLIAFGGLKNSIKIRDLLKLLAFQVGSQVSIGELATILEMSRDTVDRYIDLLEKSFVVFRLAGFSRNLRKEVAKMDKIYFYDNGVRNIVIDNMKQLKDRSDVGQLWENFLVVERIKKNSYTHVLASQYFWRTYTGAELDLVEEAGGKLEGFEFKFSQRVVKVPKSWLLTYPGSGFQTVNKTNWQEFVTG